MFPAACLSSTGSKVRKRLMSLTKPKGSMGAPELQVVESWGPFSVFRNDSKILTVLTKTSSGEYVPKEMPRKEAGEVLKRATKALLDDGSNLLEAKTGRPDFAQPGIFGGLHMRSGDDVVPVSVDINGAGTIVSLVVLVGKLNEEGVCVYLSHVTINTDPKPTVVKCFVSPVIMGTLTKNPECSAAKLKSNLELDRLVQGRSVLSPDEKNLAAQALIPVLANENGVYNDNHLPTMAETIVAKATKAFCSDSVSVEMVEALSMHFLNKPKGRGRRQRQTVDRNQTELSSSVSFPDKTAHDDDSDDMEEPDLSTEPPAQTLEPEQRTPSPELKLPPLPPEQLPPVSSSTKKQKGTVNCDWEPTSGARHRLLSGWTTVQEQGGVVGERVGTKAAAASGKTPASIPTLDKTPPKAPAASGKTPASIPTLDKTPASIPTLDKTPPKATEASGKTPLKATEASGKTPASIPTLDKTLPKAPPTLSKPPPPPALSKPPTKTSTAAPDVRNEAFKTPRTAYIGGFPPEYYANLSANTTPHSVSMGVLPCALPSRDAASSLRAPALHPKESPPTSPLKNTLLAPALHPKESPPALPTKNASRATASPTASNKPNARPASATDSYQPVPKPVFDQNESLRASLSDNVTLLILSIEDEDSTKTDVQGCITDCDEAELRRDLKKLGSSYEEVLEYAQDDGDVRLSKRLKTH